MKNKFFLCAASVKLAMAACGLTGFAALLSSCANTQPSPNAAPIYRGGFYAAPKSTEEVPRINGYNGGIKNYVGEKPSKTTSSPTFPSLSSTGLSPTTASAGQILMGKASWYGPGFHGKLTSSGETFDQDALTVAHKTLPFGTQLKITNLANDKSLVAVVNDRGPFVPGRIIDGSKRVAEDLDYIGTGTTDVKIEVLGIDQVWAARNTKTKRNNSYAAVDNLYTALPKEVAEPAQPSPLPKETYPQPVNSSKAVSLANYGAPKVASAYLQVGAFTTNARALAYSQQVTKKMAGELSGGTIFTKADQGIVRVFIGPLASSKVESLQSQLTGAGIPSVKKTF